VNAENRAWIISTVTGFCLLAFVALSFVGTPPYITLPAALQATLGLAALASLGVSVGQSWSAVEFRSAVQSNIREKH
jgi:hypothetical protein